LDELTVIELRELLTDLSSEVKKEYRVVLRGHFFDQLSYQEIATRRKISLGSVGVYLQRGLGSLRNALARRPKLKGEFLSMLSDATAVRVLLPIIGAVQAGGWFFVSGIRFSLGPRLDESQLSDEQRLQMASEGVEQSPELRTEQQALLAERFRAKHPMQFQKWQQVREERRQEEEESKRRWEEKERRTRVVAWSVLAVLAAVMVYGLVRLVQMFISR